MRSDIFSYGLVLYYMIAGDKPWAAEKSHVVSMERMKEGKALPKPPQNLGKGPLNDLYDSCVRLRSKERPTAAEIINKTFQGKNSYLIKHSQFYHLQSSVERANLFTLFMFQNVKAVFH